MAGAAYGRSLLSFLDGRTSSTEDGGPDTLGRTATDRGGEPTPSPTAHLAGQHGPASRYRRAPAIDPTRHARARVGRNLALDLLVAVGVGVTLAVVTTLLPTIARRGGLEPIGLAALGAAPFVANLLGAFAGRFGPRTPRAPERASAGSARRRSSSSSCCPCRR